MTAAQALGKLTEALQALEEGRVLYSDSFLPPNRETQLVSAAKAVERGLGLLKGYASVSAAVWSLRCPCASRSGGRASVGQADRSAASP